MKTTMTTMLWSGAVLCFALIIQSCQTPNKSASPNEPTASNKSASLISSSFGATADGTPVTRYTMTGRTGVSVSFINYGGIITDVVAPDRRGEPEHIVLGFPTLREYETVSANNGLYFGALIGRYASWINKGRFTLDGKEYQITLSDPPNTIHGGRRGFDKRIWNVQPQAISDQTVSALLTYTSADGEEGFPGEVKVEVTYSLTDDGAFTIHYKATTDKKTVINLTNHMNFNLAGAGSPGGVLGQMLMIDADKYLPVDGSQIPLGMLAPVENTPFDFRHPTAIGARIHDNNEQLRIADGYDQYWILNKRGDSAQPQLAARIYDSQSGRTLECLTTEPGVQIYTDTFFDGSINGIGGSYGKYSAFTLETQHFPDSPNQPNFPTTELKPGEVYQSTTVFRFGVQQ